jgi:phosphatidylserine/phosphatidylglycerophosphate/cardiolipin synthase-like enzyme
LLSLRLGQHAATQTALDSLEKALGVDLGPLRAAMNDELGRAPLHALRSATLDVALRLDDARTLTVPMPDGRPLVIEVPRAPYGLEARLRLTIGHDDDGPCLTGAAFVFDTPSHDVDSTKPALSSSSLPRVANPSSLQPKPTTLSGRFKAAATDVVADVRLRGVTVDGAGRVALDGAVTVAGRHHQSLQELAGDQLPTLPVRLPSSSSATTSSSSSAPMSAGEPSSRSAWSPMEMTRLFAFMAYGGSVRLSGDVAGAQIDVRADLAITRDLRVDAAVSAHAGAAGRNAGVAVNALADLERQTGHAIVGPSSSPSSDSPQKPGGANATPLPAGRAVTWTRDGVELAGLPVDKILPVTIRPSSSTSPRVGTPAFRAAVAALLDPVAPARPGCSTTFFARGDDVLAERLRVIGEAGPGDVVMLQTFIFKDDVTGGQVVDALIAAKKRGADVRVLVDALGTTTGVDDVLSGPPAFRRLRAAGVEASLVNSPFSPLLVLAGRLRDQARSLLDDPAFAAVAVAVAPNLVRVADDLRDPRALVERLAHAPEEALAFTCDVARVAVELDTPAVRGALGDAALASMRAVVDDSAALLRRLARDHRKQLIVVGADRGTVMMGGNNVGDDYQLERDSQLWNATTHKDLPLWNDAEARIDGAAFARDAAAAFARTWSESDPAAGISIPEPTANPATGASNERARGQSLRLVQHRPLDVGPGDGGHETTNLLLMALDGVGRGDRVTIENPYFHPIPALKDAMLRAARRGAHIDIVTNGPHENNDALLVSRLSRRFVLKDLVAEENIAVHETRGDADPIHRKTFLVQTGAGDDLYVLGSQNLDGLSTRINREVVVVGGSALQEQTRGNRVPRDAVAVGLAADARRDRDPKTSTRLKPLDLIDDDIAVVASEWARSVLVPVT